MAGERFNYSLDVSKELEKEGAEKKPEEPAPAAPAPSPERAPEEQAPSEPTEEPTPDEHAAEQESPASEESAGPAPQPPDPLEEEIKEIMTKDIPPLKPKQSLMEKIAAKHILLFLLLILLVGSWSLLRPLDLAILEQQSTAFVEQQLQARVAQQIKTEWDLLSQQEKARKATRSYAALRNSPEIIAEIERLTALTKGFSEQAPGQPYLFGIDSYVALRLAEDTSASGDRGLRASATLARMLGVFDWSAERALTYLPVLLGIGSLVLFFFLVRLLAHSSFAGLLAALMLALHPVFYSWHAAAHAGGNAAAYSVTFVVLLVFASMLQFKGKPRLALLFVLVLTLWLLSTVWEAWLMVVFLLVLFLLAYGMIAAVRNGARGNKNAWLSLAVLLAVTAVLVWIGKRTGIDNGELLHTPDVFSVSALGGLFLLLLALGAFIAILITVFKDKELQSRKVFVLVWTASSVLLSSTFPVVLPFAIPAVLTLATIAAERIARWLSKLTAWLGEQPLPLVARSIGCVIVGLVVLGSMWAPARAAPRELPVMNDAIAETAKYIMLHSKPNAVILTLAGWDALWQHAARRNMVLDHSTNNADARVMLARAFTTADEQEAQQLFRTLSCRDQADCTPPEGFVVVSEHWVRQLPVLAAQEDGTVPNPDRVTAMTPCSGKNILQCSGYRVNLSSLDAIADGKHPAAITIYRPTDKRSRVFEDAASQYALVLSEDHGRFTSLLVDKELSESMLVRLVANDNTLKYIAPLVSTRQPERILAFTVVWEGRNRTLQNIVPATATATEFSTFLAAGLKD